MAIFSNSSETGEYHHLSTYIILAPRPERTLKGQKISLEVTRILKAFQNAQSVDQLPTLDNMVEQEKRR
jgi:hypothetical protein